MGESAIGIPEEGFGRTILGRAGSVSGRDADKIRELGLHAVALQIVSVPAISEASITLECCVAHRQLQDRDALPAGLLKRFHPEDLYGTDFGSNRDMHIAYYGEIVAAYEMWQSAACHDRAGHLAWSLACKCPSHKLGSGPDVAVCIASPWPYEHEGARALRVKRNRDQGAIVTLLKGSSDSVGRGRHLIWSMRGTSRRSPTVTYVLLRRVAFGKARSNGWEARPHVHGSCFRAFGKSPRRSGRSSEGPPAPCDRAPFHLAWASRGCPNGLIAA